MITRSPHLTGLLNIALRAALLGNAATGKQVTGRGEWGRRTPGFRREELSLLSGVSVTWYTWLEQGRDIAPSRQVIDALCRTLELSAAEREYVLRLAGHPYQQSADEEPNTLPAHGQRLLDAMGDSPAYAITPGWSIVAWNPAYEAFYPNIATVVPEDRNLLWLVFTDHRLRTMLTDWDADSRRFLAQFRAETGHRVHQPAVTRLVARLQAVSQEFRNGWADHDVEQFISRERTFTHPTVGDLLLEHHRLSLSDCPGVNLIMYTASPDTGTAEKLARRRIGETPECV